VIEVAVAPVLISDWIPSGPSGDALLLGLIALLPR
jgi:hypothetical protein